MRKLYPKICKITNLYPKYIERITQRRLLSREQSRIINKIIKYYSKIILSKTLLYKLERSSRILLVELLKGILLAKAILNYLQLTAVYDIIYRQH